MSELTFDYQGIKVGDRPWVSEVRATLYTHGEHFDTILFDGHAIQVMHYQFGIGDEIVQFYTGCTATIQALSQYRPGDTLELSVQSIHPRHSEITILTVRSAA